MVSPLRVFPGGDVSLENSHDQKTFEDLTCSTLAIDMCMRDFILKWGTRAVQEEDNDSEGSGFSGAGPGINVEYF